MVFTQDTLVILHRIERVNYFGESRNRWQRSEGGRQISLEKLKLQLTVNTDMEVNLGV